MNVSVIFQNNAMLINFDGDSHCIDDSHPHYDEILAHLKAQENEAAKRLCEISFEIINWGDDELTVQGGEMIFKGKPLGDRFVKRITQMMDENQDREPLKKFLANLFRNPSNRSIEQVPEFVYACDLPITTDGCILAYKKVRDDFTDCHSGKFDNSPGSIVKEDRRLISDDPTRTCDRGLHVCSWHYINPNGGGMFQGGKLILCKVNPENIVCVPTDYNRTKMRVCEYEVIEEITDTDDPTKVYERETVWSIKPDVDDSNNYQSPFEDEELDELDDYEEEYYGDDEDEEEIDVESDVEQRHAVNAINAANTSNGQPRDSKGRFAKTEESKVEKTEVKQPRDSKGRFAKWFGGNK